MARPKKPKHLRRSKRVLFRVTPEEETTLLGKAQSAGLTISDLLRKIAFGAKPLIRKATPMRAALIRGLAELGKLGSNVNQIARAINRQQAAGNEINVPNDVIENAMHGIQTLSDHLINELEDGH